MDSKNEHGSNAVSATSGPKYRSPTQAAVVGLFRVSDGIRRQLGQAVVNEGITLQQFNVLRILRGARPEGLATLDIAERMLERAPGVTRLLDRLGKAGLVQRERDTEDRRRVVVEITREGLSLLERVDGPFEAMEDSVLESLEPHEIEQLAELLQRALGSACRAPPA